MEFLFGLLSGIPFGFVSAYAFYYIRSHKDEINYQLNLIRSDIQQFYVKLEQVNSSLKK